MDTTQLRIPLWKGDPGEPTPMAIGIGTVYKGCLMCTNAAGYLLDGADTAGLKVAGIGRGGGTATSNGEFDVNVFTDGIIKLENSVGNPVLQAHVMSHCYIEDNDTVCATGGSTNKIRAGMVVAVESDGVWVHVRKETWEESPDLEDGGDDELDMTGMDADTMAITLTGAAGTVYDLAKPTTVLEALDRIAGEMARTPGGIIKSIASHASLFVDDTAGLDTNDGTVGNPVLTMDRLAEIVPNSGYCNVYVTGDPVWTGAGAYPYAGYKGHLQIFSVDALTVVGAPDVVAAYGAGTGTFGLDQVTPTVLVPADATDRSRFLVLTDDAAAQHLVRIVEEVSGVWQTESAGLTITGANAVSLVTLTSTLAPVNAVFASPTHHEGDVKIIGFNVTSPGINGMTGFGFAACVIDASAHVTALNLGYNATLGGITIEDDAGPLAPAAYCPSAALTGSNLEDLINRVMISGCHLTMAGGASLLRLISSSAPGCGRIMGGTVWEAGDVYVGNPEAFLLMDEFRGVLAASGLQQMDGSRIRMGDGQLGDLIQSAGCQIELTGEIRPTSVDHDGLIKAAGTGANETVGVTDAVKFGATSDTVCFIGGQHSKREGVTISGNMWDDAGGNIPAVRLEGDSEHCRFTLSLVFDRGTASAVELLNGKHDFGAFTGDNDNVGGSGLSILGVHTSLAVDNGFAITGNSGATTTIGIGSKGLVALPGAGTSENDFAAAGAITGVETMAMFIHRA